jgi:hypothetical protein
MYKHLMLRIRHQLLLYTLNKVGNAYNFTRHASKFFPQYSSTRQEKILLQISTNLQKDFLCFSREGDYVTGKRVDFSITQIGN